jgi:hypothetical protein
LDLIVSVLVVVLLLVGLGWALWLLRRPVRVRCRHEWDYGRRTASGWGVVRCLRCGASDLY